MAGELQAKRVQQMKQNSLAALLSNPNSYGPDGTITPQANQAISGIDPSTGLKIREQTIEDRVRQAQEMHYKTEAGKAKFDYLSGVAGIATDAYDAAIKSGRSEQDAKAAAMAARNEALKNNGGVISDQDEAKAAAMPFDPLQARTFAMSNSDYAKRADRAKEGSREDAAVAEKKREFDISSGQRQQEIGLENKKIDVMKKNREQDSLSAPGEVEYTDKDGKLRRVDALYDSTNKRYVTAVGGQPIEGTDFRPLKGGEAGMGNRAEVMLNRVTSAANEATAAAKNIMELPITTTRGMFGGRSQGHGLFEATKEDLANTMTGQEAQDYNTMLAGVARNLAAIETAGLAPSGSLTHSMDALALKEGDTNLTKLRKMAEMRQIVEKGIEPNLANPKIPVEQKDMIKGIVKDIQEAIPFTQHDITQFEYSDGKKGSTFMDFAKKSGIGSDKEAKNPTIPNGWSVNVQ
jgi:hypothetical protein